MNMTKEEYIACLNYQQLSPTVRKCFEQLINEHFKLVEVLKETGWDGFDVDELKTIIKAGQYNSEKLNSLRKPYKFEDFKIGMWIWDNKEKKCNKIIEISDDKIGFYYVTDNLTRFTCKFEENRFYPVQMANVGCE